PSSALILKRMFTGIVTHVGEIARVADTPAGRALTIVAPWADVIEGESIAVNGVCLTVTAVEQGRFCVAAVATTLDRTTVGAWKTRASTPLSATAGPATA